MYELLNGGAVISFAFDPEDLNGIDCSIVTANSPSRRLALSDVKGIHDAFEPLYQNLGVVVFYQNPHSDRGVLIHMADTSRAIQDIAIKNLNMEYINIEFKIENRY